MRPTPRYCCTTHPAGYGAQHHETLAYAIWSMICTSCRRAQLQKLLQNTVSAKGRSQTDGEIPCL